MHVTSLLENQMYSLIMMFSALGWLIVFVANPLVREFGFEWYLSSILSHTKSFSIGILLNVFSIFTFGWMAIQNYPDLCIGLSIIFFLGLAGRLRNTQWK